MSQTRHSEAAFETVIEAHLLSNGYVTMSQDGFDRKQAIFSETVLAFIRTTQPKEWVNQDARRTATDHAILLFKKDTSALITVVVTG
jgi:hypothetical protein